MTDPGCLLAELHQRFDGPIPERLLRAARRGQPPVVWDELAAASLDLDHLARGAVRALAGLRAARRVVDRPAHGPAEARIAAALAYYRRLGVRTVDRLAAAGGRRPMPGA